MINIMARELKPGTMVPSDTRETLLTLRKPEREGSSSMETTMKENLRMVNSRDKESTTSLILVKFTSESSMRTTLLDMVS